MEEIRDLSVRRRQENAAIPSSIFKPKRTPLSSLSAPTAIFLLALLVRSAGLDKSLSADEVHSVVIASRDAPALIREALSQDSHPPLYYLLLHLFVKISKEEVWLRLPSVLSGAALASVSYILGKEAFGGRFGLVLGLLMAFSARSVIVSQIARNYALHAFLIHLSLLWLFRAVRYGRTIDWVKHTVAVTLAVYTFYFSILIVLLNHVSILLFHRKKEVLRPWVCSQAALFLCFLPFFPAFFHQAATVNRVAAVDNQAVTLATAVKNHLYIALTHLPGMDYRLVLPSLPVIKVIWPTVLFILVLRFAIPFLRRGEGAFGLCLVHVFGIFLLTLLLQRLNIIFVSVNYYAYVIPWLFGLVLAGIFEMGKKARWAYAGIAVILVSNVAGVAGLYKDRGGDFRAAVAYIDRTADDDAMVCTVADFISACYRFYTTRPLRAVGLPGEVPGATPGMTMYDDKMPALLGNLLAGRTSVWMMYAHVTRGAVDRGKDRAREILFQNGFRVDQKMSNQFGGVEVECFQAQNRLSR